MIGEWEAYEKHYGPLLVHDRVDVGMARITQHLSGGKLIDHLPVWMRPPLDPADDMIMKFRSLADAWKIKRLNEEVEHGRSRKRSRSPDNRGRDEPEGRDDASKRSDEGV